MRCIDIHDDRIVRRIRVIEKRHAISAQDKKASLDLGKGLAVILQVLLADLNVFPVPVFEEMVAYAVPLDRTGIIEFSRDIAVLGLEVEFAGIFLEGDGGHAAQRAAILSHFTGQRLDNDFGILSVAVIQRIRTVLRRHIHFIRPLSRPLRVRDFAQGTGWRQLDDAAIFPRDVLPVESEMRRMLRSAGFANIHIRDEPTAYTCSSTKTTKPKT